MSVQLQWAQEDIEQFAAAASHEIRDPLREALEHSPPEAAAHLELALRRIALLRDYSWLCLNQEQAGPVDLGAELRAAAAELSDLIRLSGADIKLKPLPEIKGVARQWRLLFLHLLRNALQYNDCLNPQIRIEWQDGLRISDNGVGIAPEYRELLCGLFRRGEDTMGVEGDGCGLAFCRRIARNHGLELSFADAEGGGTVAVVSASSPLPMGEVNQAD